MSRLQTNEGTELRTLRLGVILLGAGLASSTKAVDTPSAAVEIAKRLETIAQVGPQGRGSTAAREARDVIVTHGVSALRAVLCAMDTTNVIAANWCRAAYEEIVRREMEKPAPNFPVGELRDHVRDARHSGCARRLVLELLDGLEPGFRRDVLPGLLDDPEFRPDAVEHTIERAAASAAQGRKEEARDLYRTAFLKARDREQWRQAADALQALGENVSIVEQMGFVTRWYLIGPFDAPGTSGFATPFPPESGIDLDARYAGKDGKEIAWRLDETHDRFGEIDLTRAISRSSEAVCYAYADVISPRAREVEVRSSADDNITVWLNGRRLLGHEMWLNGTRPDRFTVKASLAEGKNRVLVKVCQGPQHRDPAVGNNWVFHLRFCDETGAAVPLENALPASARTDDP